MEVAVTRESEKFRPITLTITIESEFERSLLESMLLMTVSVPNVVFDSDSKGQRTRLANLMQQIRMCLV